MRKHAFFVWSLIGAVAWVVLLTMIGYVLGRSFPQLGKYIDLVTYGLLAVTVVVLGFEWWRKRREQGARPGTTTKRAASHK
jgi:membrane-associated protein